ncbi:universal stress protein [Actinacidiphila glaucinigra]
MDPVVTVGLDGSPESLAAARWAAGQAERRRLTLRLLHAWPMLAPKPTRLPAEVDQNYWAKRLVHNTRAELQDRHPGLTIIGDLVADDAEHALLQAASESEMVVLGSRGLDPVGSYFLGDIGMPVVSRAACPVVLVRAGGPGTEQVPPSHDLGGVVVVALKLHGPCDDLLEFAFTSAAALGTPLRVVHGRSLPLHARVPWGVDHELTQGMRKDAHTDLLKVLRPWHEKFPQVIGADTVLLESPASAVLHAATDAALLVVGRREHRPALAPHLGGVASAAVHHARCPVAVVPHD